MPTINVTNSLRAGLEKAISQTWQQEFPIFEKQLKVLAYFLPYTSKRKAPYAFKESVPFPKFWPYGKGRTRQTLRDRLIELSIYPYELTIPWNYYDAEDDQLGDLQTHVATAIKRFLMLPDKLIAEYLNGTASLNPALVLAYDGVSTFSATDGDGAARFAATGGNIVTGSGVATVASFVHDLIAAQRRFMAFRDVASQPIFDEEAVKYTNLHVFVPTALNELVQKASNSEFMRTDSTTTMPDSNWLKGQFKYHINPYLTDTSDWFVAVEHSYWKPFMYRAPKETRQIIEDFNNSDNARNTNEFAFMADLRVGLAPWVPFTIIKINN